MNDWQIQVIEICRLNPEILTARVTHMGLFLETEEATMSVDSKEKVVLSSWIREIEDCL